MKEHSDAEIASELVGYHRIALDSESVLRRQGAEWAPVELTELALDNPARCWRVICLAASQAPNEDALSYFGVTLSELLRVHPESIHTIAHDVSANPKLRKIMSWVMEDDEIDRSVWACVESLSESNK